MNLNNSIQHTNIYSHNIINIIHTMSHSNLTNQKNTTQLNNLYTIILNKYNEE